MDIRRHASRPPHVENIDLRPSQLGEERIEPGGGRPGSTRRGLCTEEAAGRCLPAVGYALMDAVI